MSIINEVDHNFSVGLKQAYVIDDMSSIPEDIKQKFKPVKILDKPRYVVYNENNPDKMFDVVSGVWEGVSHEDIVKSVRDDILPALGWTVKKTKRNLWMDDAVMFYEFETETEFHVGNTKLFGTIIAVNSHNRFTKYGVHVTIRGEDGTTYLPTSAGKAVYTYESMLHRKGTLDPVQLQRLVQNIPTMINNTINCWNSWDQQILEYPRLYILAQLFNYRLGEEIISRMAQGGSRFNMYKIICEYMLNENKMSESGFNSLTQMVKFIRIMKNDEYFNCDMESLKARIKNVQLFDWEDKELKKEERKQAKENKSIETKQTVVNDNTVQVADIGGTVVSEEVVEEETKQQVDSLLKDLF